jgi:hypothetical protein
MVTHFPASMPLTIGPGPSAMTASSYLTPSLPQQPYVIPQHYIHPQNLQQHLQPPQGYSQGVYLDYPCPDYVSNTYQYPHTTPSSTSNPSTYTASSYTINPHYGHYLTAPTSSSTPTFDSFDLYSTFPQS